MKIVDRYIIRELIGPFVFGIIAFTSIIAGSTVLFPMVSKAMKYGIPIMEMGKVFIYRIPSVVVFTFPMSILLSSIVLFGRMSSDSEIIAFRASGVSFYRIIAPVAILGLIVSFINMGFNEFIVPKATYNAERLKESLKQSGPQISERVNITEYDTEGSPLRIINIKKVEKEKLKEIAIAEYDNGILARVIRAEKGTWNPKGTWEFQNGVMHSFSASDLKRVMVIEFERELIDIQIDLNKRNEIEKEAEEMSAKELKNVIAYKKRTGQGTTDDEIQYYMKFALPFTSLIFSILGVCVGIRPNRSSSAMGFGLSLLIIIVYYILTSLSMGIGLGQVIPPVIAAWLPNLIVGGVALRLLQKLAYQ